MIPKTAPSLTKPSVYETQTVRLTSRMLHIGSAVSQLNPFEYVQSGGFVYLPNQEVLARSLRSRGFLNTYVQRIEAREGITDLLENALGDDWLQAQDDDGEAIFPQRLRIRKWAQGRITDFRPMIRDGFGHHYIPGSSIKGAMRTAIAYHLLKHAKERHVPEAQRISAIEHRLQKSMGDLKRRAKFFDDDVFMDELFTNFALKGDCSKGRTGPNTDFMRAVHVSDSAPLSECKLTSKKTGRPFFKNLPVAVETIVSSRFQNYGAKYRASLYVEMLFNLDATFTLAIDHDLLSRFQHNQGMELPFKTVAELLAICQEFVQEQWEAERFYWEGIKNNRNGGKNLDFSSIRDLYEQDRCPYSLRLGWASGLLGTTVALCLEEELVESIRDTCGIAAPNYEAPKSRRTVMNAKGDIRYVPGWVKLEAV